MRVFLWTGIALFQSFAVGLSSIVREKFSQAFIFETEANIFNQWAVWVPFSPCLLGDS